VNVIAVTIANGFEQPIPAPIPALIVKDDLARTPFRDPLDSVFSTVIDIAKTHSPKVHDVMKTSAPCVFVRSATSPGIRIGGHVAPIMADQIELRRPRGKRRLCVRRKGGQNQE
jgi:hypothetical protein